tara:strand:+ start:419 stop:580 length:162 start_codon:yes stop_codon:yes gene_type:complete
MLPKIITKLWREEPGFDIKVLVTHEASNLKHREADIAIRRFYLTQNDLITKNR